MPANPFHQNIERNFLALGRGEVFRTFSRKPDFLKGRMPQQTLVGAGPWLAECLCLQRSTKLSSRVCDQFLIVAVAELLRVCYMARLERWGEATYDGYEEGNPSTALSARGVRMLPMNWEWTETS